MTILGVTISLTVFWLAAAVIFLIIEALTMGLTTIWFAGGALAALVVSLLDGGIVLQVVVFLAVSVILLVSTRKVFVKKLHTGEEKTNVDALIGMEAMVIKDIKPFDPGMVRLSGQDWTAVCEESGTAVKDQRVEVIAIEGVKAIVRPVEE